MMSQDTTGDDAVRIVRYPVEGTVWYTMTIAPGAVSPLDVAIAKAGRALNGYTIEAVLVRLSEIGDPDWAVELEFDSETEQACVRCRRREPLVHLARRLRKRLAAPAALKRLVRSIGNDEPSTT